MSFNRVLIGFFKFQESDHPHILLQRKRHFYKMVQQTGAAMAANLMDIAAKVRDKSMTELIKMR